MIGLSVVNDANSNIAGQMQHRRSHKFVERLQGRFFVAGVSGSFQKYTRLVAEINANKDEKLDDSKKVSEPFLVRKQRIELANDAKRLLEIEEKLEEIKRRKLMRKNRDAARKRSKLETLSLQKIQRAYRKYIRTKKSKAVSIILSALKVSVARQGVSTLVWAMKILRRFFIRITPYFRARRLLRQEIQFAAQDCWLIVSEVACVWTASRRKVADEVVFASFKSAINSIASLAKVKAKRPLQRQGTKKKLTKTKTARDSSGLQFFLTECDGQNGQPSDDESSDGSSYHRTPIKTLQRQKTVRSEALLEPAPLITASTKHSVSSSNLLIKEEVKKPRHRKTYDENDAKVARLKAIHQNKINQMEAEKLQRMANINEHKVKKDQESLAEQQRLKQEREHQEQIKSDFIQRLEDERALKRQNFKASYHLKLKEEKLQNAELALMNKEDRLSRLCRTLQKQAQKPPAAAPKPIVPNKPAVKPKPVVSEPVVVVAQPKKPYVPRQAVSATKIAESKAKEISIEELQLIEFKRQRDEKYNSEEAIKRNREAVQRRVAAKLARASQAEKDKELAEAALKTKLDQIALESKKHLQQALTREQALKKFVKNKMKSKKVKKSNHQSNGGAAHDILNSEDEDNESDEEKRKQEYMRIISSAKEDYTVAEDDFEIENFFDQKSLMQVYVAPSLQEIAQGTGASGAVNKPPSPAVVVSKRVFPAVPSVNTNNNKPKSKPALNIPAFLRNTPYFADYEKHVDVPEIKLTENVTQSRKKTPPFNAHAHANGTEEDFNFVKRSNGKVASLIETISEARKSVSLNANNNQPDGPATLEPIDVKGLTSLKIPAGGNSSKKTLDSFKRTAAPLSFKMAPPDIPLPAMSEHDLMLMKSSNKYDKNAAKSGKQIPVSSKDKSAKQNNNSKAATIKLSKQPESESESDDDAAEEMKLLNDYATLKQRLTESFNADNDAKGMSHENLPVDDNESLPRRIELTEELLMGSFEEQQEDERSDYEDDEDEDEGEGLNELDELVDRHEGEDDYSKEEEDVLQNENPNLDDDDCMQLLQNLTAKINK